VQQAAAVTKPPLFGLGLAFSNVGDGNVQVSALQSFGGRIADDTGTKAAIKSNETREYLRWVKDAWDKKVFPPGNTTWDGAGDNQAYLAGQTAFIANTGSVGIAARTQDPELYKDTAYSALPGGPKGVVSPLQPQVRAVSKSSKNPDAAKALIEHLAQPAFMNAYYDAAIYGPVLQDQAKFKGFTQDPILSGLLDLVQKGTAPGYPDVYNAAYADMWNNFVVPKMVQRVVIDNWDFDRAMDEAQLRRRPSTTSTNSASTACRLASARGALPPELGVSPGVSGVTRRSAGRITECAMGTIDYHEASRGPDCR
jgi:multiple sugar transport system substrate-binding protein